MKKILVIAPDCPYPPNHGGRKDVFSRIEMFHRRGHAVDLLFTTYDAPAGETLAVLEGLCSKVAWVRRQKIPLFVPFLQSFQIRSRAALAKVDIAGDYDLVLLESEYVSAVLNNPGLAGCRHIALRVHNNESSYYFALAEAAASLVKKLYFWSEAVYFRMARSAIFARVDNLYFISHDEYVSMQSPNSRFLPTYVDPGRFREQQAGGAVVFVGNLFAQNNLAGLQWYMDQVHPRLAAHPRYQLVIAGNTKGVVPGFLQQAIERDPRIRFFDSPPELDAIYRSGSVFINPMLTGAGVKIKTVDAIANGLPVVSTDVGIEGIGLRAGDAVIVANDATAFAVGVERLLDDPAEARRMFMNARSFLMEHYADPDRIEELR